MGSGAPLGPGKGGTEAGETGGDPGLDRGGRSPVRRSGPKARTSSVPGRARARSRTKTQRTGRGVAMAPERAGAEGGAEAGPGQTGRWSDDGRLQAKEVQGRGEQPEEQQQPEQQPQERPRPGAAGRPGRGLHVSLHGVREVELVRSVAQLGAGLADPEGVRDGHAVHLRERRAAEGGPGGGKRPPRQV